MNILSLEGNAKLINATHREFHRKKAHTKQQRIGKCLSFIVWCGKQD